LTAHQKTEVHREPVGLRHPRARICIDPTPSRPISFHDTYPQARHGNIGPSGLESGYESTSMATITVALVEDDPGTRERICRVLRAEPSLQLVHAAGTAEQLLQWMAEGNLVDVLLVDLGLPDRTGIEVVQRCTRMQPSCAVMVLTMFGDESNMLRAFEAGARGYLLKDGTEEDLATHVRALHQGGSPMSPLIARQLVARWQKDHGHASATVPSSTSLPDESLSPREMEVLNLIARGFTYAEIGVQLSVSITTIQTHVRNIYAKLGVHSKTEAVFEARQVGLLR
jgi:DNA-binding NarL/FixJ family response regulator